MAGLGIGGRQTGEDVNRLVATLATGSGDSETHYSGPEGGDVASKIQEFKENNPNGNVYDFLHSQYGGNYDNAKASQMLKELSNEMGITPDEFIKGYSDNTFSADAANTGAVNLSSEQLESLNKAMDAEAASIIEDFLKNTRAETNARIKNLQEIGYDTTGLQESINGKRNELARNQANNTNNRVSPVVPERGTDWGGILLKGLKYTSPLIGPVPGLIADGAQWAWDKLTGNDSSRNQNPNLGQYHGNALPVSNEKFEQYGISYGINENHGGLDIPVPIGTELYAPRPGIVDTAQWDDYNPNCSFGNYLRIDHGDGTYTYIGHMSEFKVTVNQYVQGGQFLGLSGNTGTVDPLPTPENPNAGAHVHFELRDRYGRVINPY